VALGLLGCGGSPTAPSRDEVFYLHQRGVIDKRYSWERYFPPLDREAKDRVPRRVGVAIFEGDVRLSRPVDWYLRTADYRPEHRQVSYQSPRQFLFTIYERIDPPRATWDDVLVRYEEQVKESGAEILAARIPVTTANAEGRSYLLRTKIPAKPQDFDNYAHEILVRSSERIMLVQIVHPEDIQGSVDEMTSVLTSMLVY